MKPFFQIIALVFLVFLASSCRKEKITSLSVPAQQKDDKIKLTHYVGESFGGGIIFSLNDSATHGLIVSKQEVLASWWNGAYIKTFATADAIGTGQSNTKKIIGAQGAGRYAAFICAQFTFDGYTDWYLPSKGELFELYTTKNLIGGFQNAPYWSSTEENKYQAWYQNFSLGNQFTGSKDGAGYIRAIRTF
jgi:hypothetical protein